MSPNKISNPAVFCLMGPTASGKTSLAVQVAARLPVDLVSVDSTQVYRGMDIGSGKPDRETLSRAPHRLLDIRDPAEPYSAADFRSDALTAIREIVAAGRIPLLVGGTMLYFKVLRDGIADMPDASPGVRAGIEELARATGWRGVHDELARVDPESARRIHPNDPQRLQRALEVYRVSGRTMTELHEEGQKRGNLGPGHDFPLRFFAVEPESRATLHKKITDRFHDMLSMGLVAEVEKLYRREDLSIDLPSIRSVGYRQVWQYLSGHYDYDAMIERGIIATRQLAKRQLTWLRSWPALTGLGSRHEISLERLLNTMNADSI